MRRSESHPPVVGAAVAFAIGTALALRSAHPLPSLPLATGIAFSLVWLWRRPTSGAIWFSIALAGLVSASAARSSAPAESCISRVPVGSAVAVRVLLTERGRSGMVPARLVEEGHEQCDPAMWMRMPPGTDSIDVGHGLQIRGRVEQGRLGPYLRVDEWLTADAPVPRILGLRRAVEERIDRLFGERASLVSALILADKSELDPEVREDFTRSGTAHLLAISGFHVGILAAIFVALLRVAGRSARGSVGWAAVAVWGYVIWIGAPPAAARAATLLTLVAAARVRGRLVRPSGALATAFLVMLLLRPEFLTEIGFQLSFAGSWGLVSLGPRVRSVLARSAGGWGSASLRASIAAGVATTVTTLPLVAFHFGRVSSVGIPATLFAGPLVAFLIPAILATLAVSVVHAPLSHFLAGGVSLVLELLVWVTERFAALPGATLPIASMSLLFGIAGCALWWIGARRLRLGPAVRPAFAVLGVATALLVQPVVLERLGGDDMEIVVLDVGQGDAILFRSEDRRWALVDAGPAFRDRNAARSVILPYLAERGIDRLEFVIFTHPDLDHIGGAEALLEGIEVGAVLGPALPVGRGPYLAALHAAMEQGVGWWRAEPGSSIHLDGMRFELLAAGTGEVGEDSNETSVVFLLRAGAFRALFTGDASTAVEDRLVGEGAVEPLDLLKAGHHGSRTSTSERLVEATRPALAIVSAGRNNRFGHPHFEVTNRLERHGVRILRTDRSGHIRIRIPGSGRYVVETERDGT